MVPTSKEGVWRRHAQQFDGPHGALATSSKSLGNFVGVTEPAGDMFGKLMSISDELMARYYLVLLGRGAY